MLLNAFLFYELNRLQHTELGFVSYVLLKTLFTACGHACRTTIAESVVFWIDSLNCSREPIRRNKSDQCKGREILLFGDWKDECHVLVYNRKPTSPKCLTHFIFLTTTTAAPRNINRSVTALYKGIFMRNIWYLWFGLICFDSAHPGACVQWTWTDASCWTTSDTVCFLINCYFAYLSNAILMHCWSYENPCLMFENYWCFKSERIFQKWHV